MSTVNPTTIAPIAPSTTGAQKTTGTQDAFGKDAFMKLLVEQLRNQSPDSSNDPDKFMDQMTQFSILEQLTNQSTDEQRANAAAYIGKTVSWATADGRTGQGVVDKVDFTTDKGPQLTVAGQGGIGPSDVIGVIGAS
jgi:flagellar basal-body rod modification protein FlgD